jgi:membrane protein implicated in regulation of membrane protease activity
MSGLSERRRRRIARELRALHAMQGHLRTRDLVWAVLAIPLLIGLCVLVAAKLHWLGGSPLYATIGAAAAGTLIWWIGRRWFALATWIVLGLVLVLFDDVPSFDWGDDKPNRKQQRRAKLARAIAKREALLSTSSR